MATRRKNKSGFIKSAVIIAGGGFVAKLIGAVYRVPLTNFIGSEGIGLYQMVFPFYCLLLTVSATGIPSAIAALTAERVAGGKSGRLLFKTAMKLFLFIGGLGTLLMGLIAPALARAQGEISLIDGYRAIAPAVLLVSAISVFRGYFQGYNKMSPTAVSEIIEQVVKVGAGLVFAYIHRGNPYRAVTWLLFAVSLSEGAALLFLCIKFRRLRDLRERLKDDSRVAIKGILKRSFPVTLSSGLIPLSSLLDSILAVRMMGRYSMNPVGLYGLFSGGAVTVINLPVSICYGLAAASIPAVAGERGDFKKRKKKIIFSLLITLLVSIPCAVGLYLFSPFIVKTLFRSLTGTEKEIMSSLVKVFSISAVTLSCTQTLSACLTAQGRTMCAVCSMALGIAVKTGLELLLLQNERLSVTGLAIATNVCYAVSFMFNLLFNLCAKEKKRKRA
jgi:stage V sporulation protein B